MAKKKFYAVKKGLTTGIFDTWEKCQAAVKGYPGAEFKGFVTEEEARAYLGPEVETTFDRKPSGEAGSQAKGPRAGEGLAAYVDGSFDQTVGRYAFGCILLVPDGREIRISGSGDNPESLAIRNVAGKCWEPCTR